MTIKTKAAGTGIRAAGNTSHCSPNYTPESLTLVVTKDVVRVDSRILAGQLGVEHRSTFALILRYEGEFQEIDQLRFKNADGKRAQGGGNAERYALLTEDQSFFLLTLSRNSERVVRLKMRLVQAFRRARDGMEISKDYLPFYHQLHDEVRHLAEVAHASGSTTPECMFHITMNRMVNAAMGLESGERGTLSPQQRLAVATANFIAQKAIEAALGAGVDHHCAYIEAKRQVEKFANGAHLLLEAA